MTLLRTKIDLRMNFMNFMNSTYPLQFFFFLSLTAITSIGIIWPFPGALIAIVIVFGGIPILDWLVGELKENPTAEQEKNWRSSKVWAPALYVYTLTHFIILIVGAYQTYHAPSFSEALFCALAVGVYTGGIGITASHELCHKKEMFPRIVADLLLSSVWYQHFAVEHVRGHHFLVGTKEDPASARRDESVYKFLLRSIVGSFLHAFQIDKRSVLKGVLYSSAMTAIAFNFGVKVFIFFLTKAVIAIILLELVNYIEHYGLERKPLGNGRYERVTPIHSWNSSNKISDLLLFNLQRHSDHHAWAHLPYTVLKHHPEAPQLPSGYPGMILLALIPSLWFKTMHPRLDSVHGIK